MTKYIVAVTFTGGENQINVEKYSTFLIASGINMSWNWNTMKRLTVL
jgi:hypothetical protein